MNKETKKRYQVLKALTAYAIETQEPAEILRMARYAIAAADNCRYQAYDDGISDPFPTDEDSVVSEILPILDEATVRLNRYNS